MGLVGKRALITGSSTGLGQSIAESLAAEGASVVIHGRDEARAIAVADGIRATGGDATVTLGDLATSAGAADTAKVVSGVRMIDSLVPGMRGRLHQRR